MKNRNLTILWAVAVLSIFPFTVNNSFASVENANYLAQKGIIVDKSTKPSEYNLKNNILRQEIAVVALGIYGGTTQNYCSGKFLDVSATKPNSWACKTIEALEKYDVISDDNRYFRPQAKVTKAEALGMLIKAGLDKEYDFDSDNIRSKWNWQKQVVDFAVSKGLVSNFKDYNSFATRDFVFDIWANILKYKEWWNTIINTDSWENSIFNTNNLERYQKPDYVPTQVQNSNQTNFKTNISSTEAKNIALKNAWLTENQVFGLFVKDDFDDGRHYFEVKFYQNNTRKEFEYKIDSSNWRIVEFDLDNN